MTRIDRITSAVDRQSWALWGVLIGSLALYAWAGMEPPAGGNIGSGYVWLDLVATCVLWLSGAALVVMRAASPRRWSLLALGDYLQLLAVTITAMRMSVALWMLGDAYIAPSGVIALLAFGLSSLAYTSGHLARIGR